MAERTLKIWMGEPDNFEIRTPSKFDDHRYLFWMTIFFICTEIFACFEKIFQSYAFICKPLKTEYYNFFNISEIKWIRYHVESYLQENYILELRTKKLIAYLLKILKGRDKQNICDNLNKFNKLIGKLFKNMRRTRGSHVHNDRFDTPLFRAVESLNLSIDKGKMKKLAPLRNLNMARIKLEWKNKIFKNTKAQLFLYDELFRYFYKTLPVISNLA